MEPLIGQIMLFAGDLAPRGWATCEGQRLQIPMHTALYSIVGDRFGGDGQRVFALPDLRGKEPVPGTHWCIAIEGIYPSRG